MFESPNPGCSGECRFNYGLATTTCMYYPPSYDKHGNNLNPDGNITTSEVKCSTCGKKWFTHTRYGKTEFTEV